jgi:hypothetical protein
MPTPVITDITGSPQQATGIGTFAIKAPPSGMVKLVADTGATLTLILLDNPDRTGGVGGWQASERQTRVDADWFKSRTKGALSLPCALDLFGSPGPSLERRLAVLYRMGQAGDADAPPAIRLAGDVPRSREQAWKLDDIAQGAQRFRPDDPTKLRYVAVTLSLSELNVAEEIDMVSVRRSRTKSGNRKHRTVTVRQNDTIRIIAVRELGQSGQWVTVRDLNKKLKKVDPDQPLRRGLRLRVT